MIAIRQQVLIPLDIEGKQHVARFVTFEGLDDQREHIAMVFGDADQSAAPHVRIHSECLTGDVFGSLRCDCGPQLRDAMALFAAQGGILLYMRHEGRGIGLYNKLDAYSLQDRGHDTFEANEALGFPSDMRDYSHAAQMLLAMGIKTVHLVTNNPDKVGQLESNGIQVAGVMQRRIYVNPHNRAYLEAKRVKGRHMLSLGKGEPEGEPEA